MEENKLAVVYWSAGGNVKEMAHAIARGIRQAGAKADIYQAVEFSRHLMDEYDAIAFGCPAYNEDQLEQGMFEPMFKTVEDKLKDKKIALFGSYDWGGDAWMKRWVDRVEKDGADLLNSRGLICKGYPSEAVLAECMTWRQELAL